jgi:hypothetical protein
MASTQTLKSLRYHESAALRMHTLELIILFKLC